MIAYSNKKKKIDSASVSFNRSKDRYYTRSSAQSPQKASTAFPSVAVEKVTVAGVLMNIEEAAQKLNDPKCFRGKGGSSWLSSASATERPAPPTSKVPKTPLSSQLDRSLVDKIREDLENANISLNFEAIEFWKAMRLKFPSEDLTSIIEFLKRERARAREKTSRSLHLQKKIDSHFMREAIKRIDCLSDVDEQVVALQELYRSFASSKKKDKGSTKQFWAAIRYHAPSISIKGIPALLKGKRQGEKRKGDRAMGIGRDGTVRICKVYRCNNPLLTKAEAKNPMNFGKMIPFLTRGWFFSHVDALYNLNIKLKEQLLESASKTSNNSHHGVSLAKTVVSGGTHASKKLGISGSIHWNQALADNIALQLEVFDVVGQIVDNSFGKYPWFRKWMDFFDDHPHLKKMLIPKTPFTSVWWSFDERPFNIHHDWNTFGGACLVCPDEVPGGNIIVFSPDGCRGKILCGRWGLSRHCTASVPTGEKRFSMVFYFDSRIFTGKYKECYLTHPTQQIMRTEDGPEPMPELADAVDGVEDPTAAFAGYGLEKDGLVPPDLVRALHARIGKRGACGK